MTPQDALGESLASLLPRPLPSSMGVAVSGGGDSLALMLMLADWCDARGVTLHAVTVDHGLRRTSADEARFVAREAAGLGVAHDTLRWSGWEGRGNLQAAARDARRSLLRRWACARGVAHIALGHTMDDQAETFLQRLARGSGVDGLSGMAAARKDPEAITWLRPLLSVRRRALRDTLEARGRTWIDDPSNDDTRFSRVRLRAALSEGVLGLDVETLALTAGRMAAARSVLGQVAREAAMRVVSVNRGDVVLDASGWRALGEDTRWRLLAEALCRVGANAYRPRLTSLKSAMRGLETSRRATLHGCLISLETDSYRIGREPAATRGRRAAAPGIWDDRWRVTGPPARDHHIAALGEDGLADRPGWRATGLPRASLLASPALWKKDRLSVALLIDRDSPWRAEPLWDKESLCEGLLSH